MDILKAFKLNDKEYPINICGTFEKPLFQARQIGNLLGIKYIATTIASFSNREKVIHTMYTRGGPQKTTFLTPIGLYNLLGLSRKPIAKVFKDWVYETIEEIRLTGEYKLKQEIELERTLREGLLKLERHKTFIETMSRRRVVYFTKLKDIDNQNFILKIGFTNDIAERNRSLRNQFGGCTFLDVFECQQHADFELFLKRHPTIKQYAYREPIIDDIRSNETYKVNEYAYNEFVGIAKKEVIVYNGLSFEQDITRQKLECTMKALQILEKNPETINNPIVQDCLIDTVKYLKNDPINHTKSKIETICSYDESNEHEDIPYKSIHELQEKFKESEHNKPRANKRQRKVQQYDVQTFELIKTYEGIMDVIRKNPTYSKTPLKDAALSNRVYNGFRWFLINPDEPDNTFHKIPPTLEATSSTPRYVAVLDKEKKVILDVFWSMGQVARYYNIKSKETVNQSIKKGYCYLNKYYFVFFDDCEDNFKKQYLENNNLPEAPTHFCSKKINQIDPKTNEIIQTYGTIADVLKVFHMSRAVLKKCCETRETHMGYIWSYL